MVMTRGVLIDVAGLKGVDMLPDTYEITAQDLQQALQRQNTRLQPGDAVLIHTGWGRLYGKDNARYSEDLSRRRRRRRRVAGEAGPDPRRRRQLAGRGRAQPRPQLSLPGHQIFLVVNGIHLLENLKLDELAAKKVYEFAFAMQPLKIQGGSGSTVSPVAIR